MASEGQLLATRQKLQTLKESGELNGEGADMSENLHRLFMFPAMMVPAAQHTVIKAVADCLPVGAWAMDSFMGSGTSLIFLYGVWFYSLKTHHKSQLKTYFVPAIYAIGEGFVSNPCWHI